MVYETEESICLGSMDEFGCDLIDAVGKVVERDLRDATVGVLCWCHCRGIGVFTSIYKRVSEDLVNSEADDVNVMGAVMFK